MAHYHFISIGGSAMHALAIALKEQGHHITGSDDAIFEPSKSKLANKGLLPSSLGWFPENIHSGLDAVILGMHAKKDNPELNKAQSLGIKIYSYPEFLFHQTQNKTRVVIAGSHGKTTITAMVLHVMDYWEKKVDYMAGALQNLNAPNLSLNPYTDFAVFEGDEYLSSAIDPRPKFIHYKPNIALISGIAWDHINVFKTYEEYAQSFSDFLHTIVNGGIVVYNQEDEALKELVENSEVYLRKHPYQTPAHRIENGITYLITDFGEVHLKIFGRHNLSNLAGAQWICLHMGVAEEEFYEAISSFTGAAKRLESIVQKPGFSVFKDFAHAPSKVKASTEAVRSQFPDRNFTAFLELHTYSSLNKNFINQYRDTLQAADEAVVFFDLEALQIKNMAALSVDDIQSAFGKPGLKVFTNADSFLKYVYQLDKTNAVWLFMSSGNYGGLNFEALKD